jgi:hypothetical protein
MIRLRACWVVHSPVFGNTEDVHVPGRYFDDEQHVQAAEEDRAGVEEIAGQQPVRLSAEERLCVPKTSSTSCDQAIFVDQATDASLFSDAIVIEIDWFG